MRGDTPLDDFILCAEGTDFGDAPVEDCLFVPQFEIDTQAVTFGCSAQPRFQSITQGCAVLDVPFFRGCELEGLAG